MNNIIIDVGRLPEELVLDFINKFNSQNIIISTRRLATYNFLIKNNYKKVFLINPKIKNDNEINQNQPHFINTCEEIIFNKIISDPSIWYMYERSESEKYSNIPLQEIQLKIRLIFEYSLSIIKKYSPKKYIFFENPHKLEHRIQAIIANEFNCKVIFFQQGILPWYYFAVSGISPEIDPIRPKNYTDEPQPLISNFSEYINSKRSTKKDALPWYEKERQPYLSGYKGILAKVIINRTLLTEPKLYLKKIKCFFSLKKFSKEVDCNKKYAVFFLHYQPERTTVPDGGYYQNQILAIRKLRTLLPSDILIYVKEHPSTFLGQFQRKSRSPFFYRDIASISGVEVVPIEQDQYAMIDNSVLVASITGTVVFESLIRYKPSIVFGDGPYVLHNLTTMHKFKNRDKFNKFLKDTPSFISKDFENDIEKIISDLHNFGIKGTSNNKFESPNFTLQSEWYFSATTKLAFTIAQSE